MNCKIVFIGSGNLATQLSQALQKADYQIIQIYSKTNINAKALADKLNTEYTSDLNKINTNADLYIFALKDEIIPNILAQLNLNNKLMVHTAGSLNIEIFKNYTNQYGCIYPLQTFSKNRKVNFSQIPIFIEGSCIKTTNVLKTIASKLSKNTIETNYLTREKIHLSAIFACNFTNHLYSITADILHQNNLSFDLLKPLIIETTQKILEISPKEAQTGPALRNDQNIIEKHIELLTNTKDYQKIYRFVSESIINMHANQQKENQ